MEHSVWKTLFGDRNAPAENTAQLWARTIGGAVLGAVAALIGAWLYALVTDGDFTFGGAVASMVGAGVGLGVVIYLNNRRRRARSMELDDEIVDNLPKRLG
jgi:hypothetical protein